MVKKGLVTAVAVVLEIYLQYLSQVYVINGRAFFEEKNISSHCGRL